MLGSLVPRVALLRGAWSGAALCRLQHTFAQLPDDWRKLTVPRLEVMDTTELDSLVELSAKERERLAELRVVAKSQQRKSLRVNCDLDIKRVDRLNRHIEHVMSDKRRQW